MQYDTISKFIDRTLANLQLVRRQPAEQLFEVTQLINSMVLPLELLSSRP